MVLVNGWLYYFFQFGPCVIFHHTWVFVLTGICWSSWMSLVNVMDVFFCSMLLVFVYKYLLAQCTMWFLFIFLVFIVTKAHLLPFFLLVCIVDYHFLPLWCSLPLVLASLLFFKNCFIIFIFFGGHHNPIPPPSTFLSSCLCCDHPFPLI